MSTVLEVRNVTKTFGSLTVLKRLSLSCSPGEVVLLAGANGAGKSTLLKVIAGLSRPDEGKVLHPSARIGFLSHHLFLYGRLSVRENVELFAAVQGISDVESSLDAMELASFSARPLHELSKGMQARVGVARAFLGNPELIVLDEPTSNLDEKGTALLLSAIKRAREQSEGKAVVLIATHDLYRLAHIATRAIVLHSGSIFADSGAAASSEVVGQVLQRYREVNR